MPRSRKRQPSRPRARPRGPGRLPLWAPWRIEFILGQKTSDDRCILCDKAQADPTQHEENLILAAHPRAYVMMNRYPYTNGHLMVVPRAHVASLAELSPEDHIALWELVRDAIEALRQGLRPEGFNVGINLGKCAGGGIDRHLHVHIVPRWSGDTNFMPVLADVRVMPEYLRETWRRLRPAFERLGRIQRGG